MTKKELEKAFGNSLTPIRIRPEKIDLTKFTGLAVMMPKDCSSITAVPAMIGKPETVKCHGIIPNKAPDDGVPRFNCLVGDYTESRCAVTLSLGGQPKTAWNAITCAFGAKYMYATELGIYRMSVAEDSIGKFTEELDGSRTGIFKTAKDARSAIDAVSSEYRDGLLAKIDNIVYGSMLDPCGIAGCLRYNKTADLKETIE